MRQSPKLRGLVTLTFVISACGSEAGTPRNTGSDSVDAVPPCGTDPSQQPDRCIDSKGALRCKVNSGFAGDELALCDVPPESGFVIHFGPTDYADPSELSKYVLQPGDEQEICLHVNTPNDTEKFYDSYHGRMRPNSHHLIVTMPTQHFEDETSPWPCGPQVRDRWLFGSQEKQIDVGKGSDPSLPQPGDPDYGLAHDIPAHQTLLMDFHNLNTTDRPQLRESWTSLMYVDPSDVKVRSDLIGFYNLGISIPPLAHVTTKRQRCELPVDAAGNAQPVYLNVVTGHAHQRLQRLSLWREATDGTSELIYETRDWHEPGNALYRSRVQNPPLPITSTDVRWGATSGYVQILPGEAVSFECEYQNDLAQTVTIGETSKDEMCNVFGDYFPSVGGMWNCFGT